MANRYWVGGNDTWDAIAGTKWSATSGGAGGASVPNASDIAFFDVASGASTVTIGSGTATCLQLNMTGFTGTLAFGNNSITLPASGVAIYVGSTTFSVTGTPVINCTYSGGVGTRTIACASVTEANTISFNITAGTDIVNIQNSCKNINFTGFSGTLSNANFRTIFGNLTISSGMSLASGAVTMQFGATSGVQQITSNGKTFDFPITQNGIGGTVQLQDNLTMGSTRTYTLANGTLNLNNLILSTGLFASSNSNVRSIAFGTGNITLTGNNTTIWNTGGITNLSITGTPVINATYSGSTGTRTVTMGNSEAISINVNVSAGSDIFALANSGTVKDLNFTGFTGTWSNIGSNIYGNLTVSSGMTVGAGANNVNFITTGGSKTITTAGKIFDFPMTFSGVGGTYAFQDALTQGSTRTFIINTGTVQFKNGVTSTVGSFVADSSNVKFLQSTTPGSQATLSQAAGTVNVVDLTIRDINAIGGASWNAYTDFENTDAGNNDGWNFSLSPPYSTAELPVTLRPFTQPRRF